ncbi:acyltransferase family protein [Plantactinospora siamensis]|uniref:Acyltransferase family protein n=1 Tax=Plantactinospora siamensis TaxID=555372 RepID=A0ABV6P2W8_9ACTN
MTPDAVTATPVPDRDSPAPARAAGRDRYLDLWRAAALGRVVIYHVFGWLWLTVLFPAMGLMFALAGSLMASSLDRTGPAAVGRRMRRLLPPLWAFGAIAVPLLLLTGWRARPAGGLGWGELLWWVLPVRTPPVGDQAWAWAFNVVLWYIVTYLWLVLLSPMLLALFRRWPWPTVAVAALLPVLARFDIARLDGYFAEQATNVSSYLACWLLGFAHHDGLLRRIPARRYAAAVAGLAVAGAAWIILDGVHAGVYDLNRIEGGNTLWSMAFVATVLRFRPTLAWLARVRPLSRAVELLNARAVTVYLWHLPVGMVAALLLTPVDTHNYWANVAIRITVVWALLAVPVGLFGWVEDVAARRRPAILPPSALPWTRPAATVPGWSLRTAVARWAALLPRPGRSARAAAEPALSGAELALSRAEPALSRAEPALSGAEPALSRAEPALSRGAEGTPGRSRTRLGNGWHRAMVGGVACLSVVLAGAALHVIPGLPVPPSLPVAQAETPRYLSDQVLVLDDADAETPGLVAVSAAAGDTAVTVGGTAYPNAVVARTPSRIRVHPPSGCDRLRALTGIGGDADAAAQVTFAVQADGTTVFDSGARTAADGAAEVDVPLPTSTTAIELVATSSTGPASAVWADAHFLCAS